MALLGIDIDFLPCATCEYALIILLSRTNAYFPSLHARELTGPTISTMGYG